MDTQQSEKKEIINTLEIVEQKKFIGTLLSIGGVIFMLGGVMFFLSLVVALKFNRDILTALMVGALVTGILAYTGGVVLTGRNK